MNLTVTKASESDIPVIFEQAKALIDAYEDMNAIDYDKVLAWVKRKIETKLSEYRCALWNGEKCAFWRICDDGELDDLYVLPGFRKQGIGSEILRITIEETEKPLWLYVFSRNVRAIAFYDRHGVSCSRIVGPTRLIMERKG